MVDLADAILKGGMLVLLIAGAVSDLRTRRIPNFLTYGSALAGLVVNLSIHGLAGAQSSLTGWALGIGVLAIPFLLHGMGGGDVKFLAAVGAWGGPPAILITFYFGAIAAAVMTIIILIARGQLAETLRPFALWLRIQIAWALSLVWPKLLALAPLEAAAAPQLARTTGRKVRSLPYGPALALGGVIALVWH